MFVVFVFGAIIGSFLDVVAYRLHTEKSLNGRSHCLSCGMRLKWYELVPVVSFLVLRARCRSCNSRIPWRCLMMEVGTGLSFVLMWQLFTYDIILVALYMATAALLILVVAYDFRHLIIPDEIVGLLVVVALSIAAYRFHTEGLSFEMFMYHLLAGVLGALFFAAFWLISGGKWMGLGDAKLMLPLGIVLGPWGTFAAIVLAFWTGAGISVSILGLDKLLRAGKTHVSFLDAPLTIKNEIPFAPFLILGFALVHFFHVDLSSFFPLIYPL